jgi:Fe-coproporphyrin III synthase
MRVLRNPSDVLLLLTAKCNLRCRHCFATVYGEAQEPELRTDEWKVLIRRLSEMHVFTLGFSGGELFMREDALELLAFARSLNFSVITLTTNGTFITPYIAKTLSKIKPNRVSVSIDGTGRVNDKIRGSGAFKKTLAGVTRLLGEGIALQVQFTAMAENYLSLPELVDLLYGIGIRNVTVNELYEQGRCRAEYDGLRLKREDWQRLTQIVDAVRQRFPDLRVSFAGKRHQSFPSLHLPQNPVPQHLKPCSAAEQSCTVTPSGWVIACPPLSDFRAGNVLQQDISYIWRTSPIFAKLRELSAMTVAEIPECKDCGYHAFCSGGCRGKAYLSFGKLLGADPDCPFWPLQRKEGAPVLPVLN